MDSGLILQEIIEQAKRDWPDDPEMQKHCISEERKAFNEIQKIDFGKYANLKQHFISIAMSELDTWDERLHTIPAELSAYSEIQDLSVDGISQSTLDEWKKEAREESEGFYEGQIDLLKNRIAKHLSVVETRKKIDPIKSLLIEIEEIIGSECFNGNIQNYSSWGELDSEGRSFRYPVKFYTDDDNEVKRRKVANNISSEELITGHYAFGANELNIYRALYKVVQHLQEHYGLDVIEN